MRHIFLIFVFLIILIPLGSQTSRGDQLLQQGIEELRLGNFGSSAQFFRAVLRDGTLINYHSEALYWLIPTDINLGNFRDAAEYAERFLRNYPGDDRETDILYHRARLHFFLGDPEKAIIALSDFIAKYPRSSLIPSCWYWIGEALVDIGRLDEADTVFTNLIEQYPYSVKREAARYRRNEIALLFRERELLDILQWSHKEYLRSADAFNQKEIEYRESLKLFEENLDREALLEEKLDQIERLLEIKSSLLDIHKYYRSELLRLIDE